MKFLTTLLRSAAIALAVSFAVPAAFADDAGSIGPVYKQYGFAAICMVRCDAAAGCANSRLDIRDEFGNIVATKSWTDIPNRGSRYLRYAGIRRLITCEETGSGEELSWALLNVSGHVVALMSNDD